ncbi:hypothetical protein [Streptomyces sp. 769]|uniref:hypothetical protein n=1 Tax=Streptomyces sp. 769 TaxID=1262452 RepID=UPI000581CDED|nr:hypothetical protein [Streptomyces sp. 769]AJC61455.1 hypothetical protein GZL_08932 [Streptomyces sp. 769]
MSSNVPATTTAAAPSIHRRALITWLAAYPTITLALGLLGPLTAHLPLLLRTLTLTLTLTAIVVPIAAYALIPALMKANAALTQRHTRQPGRQPLSDRAAHHPPDRSRFLPVDEVLGHAMPVRPRTRRRREFLRGQVRPPRLVRRRQLSPPRRSIPTPQPTAPRRAHRLRQPAHRLPRRRPRRPPSPPGEGRLT